MQKTLEDTLRLDVRKLSKGGCFKRSSQGAIRWGVSGVNHLRFRYCKSYSLFKIFYAIGGESVKQQKCQSICVDQTSCHIGGHRNWFRCPLCFNRVALLYSWFDFQMPRLFESSLSIYFGELCMEANRQKTQAW